MKNIILILLSSIAATCSILVWLLYLGANLVSLLGFSMGTIGFLGWAIERYRSNETDANRRPNQILASFLSLVLASTMSLMFLQLTYFW